VIADEPSGGLDGAARAVLIDLFTALGQRRVVFFASHDAALIRGCGAKPVSFADLGIKR
jgi:heme-transporting ATPase